MIEFSSASKSHGGKGSESYRRSGVDELSRIIIILDGDRTEFDGHVGVILRLVVWIVLHEFANHFDDGTRWCVALGPAAHKVALLSFGTVAVTRREEHDNIVYGSILQKT